jgi:hypothetical protein
VPLGVAEGQHPVGQAGMAFKCCLRDFSDIDSKRTATATVSPRRNGSMTQSAGGGG